MDTEIGKYSKGLGKLFDKPKLTCGMTGFNPGTCLSISKASLAFVSMADKVWMKNDSGVPSRIDLRAPWTTVLAPMILWLRLWSPW